MHASYASVMQHFIMVSLHDKRFVIQEAPEVAADFARDVLIPSQTEIEQTTDLRRGVDACARWSCQGASSPLFAEALVSGKAALLCPALS